MNRLPDGIAMCDLCGDEFAYSNNGAGPDDVFHKIREQLGRVVCPDCIGDTQAHQIPRCAPVLQPAVDGLPSCACARVEKVVAVPRLLGIWRCATCGGEVRP